MKRDEAKIAIDKCETPQLIAHSAAMNFTDAITVEAWVDCHDARAEALQQIVGQWSPRETMDRFDAYDAGQTSGLETKGFFGAVFDGRYIYFVPQHDEVTRHGRVLRFDTHGDFKDTESWTGYDAGQTDGLNTRGYYGAVYDGRYIYFVPRRDPAGFHTRVLRYDTHGGFQEAESWEAHDVGLDRSYQSAAFDGRYIYFVPGHVAVHRSELKDPDDCASPPVTGMDPDYILQGNSIVLRYDTQGEGFKNPASWRTYDAANTGGLNTSDYDGACFDGRYIYFSPLSTGVVLRYDTQAAFEDSTSWAAFDANPLGMKLNVGAVYDGRWVYFVLYGESEVAIRYDTTGAFEDQNSWQTQAMEKVEGLGDTRGFDGAVFDGRYVYYVPYFDNKAELHGKVLRFDATREFTDSTAWGVVDAGFTDGMKTIGFNAAAFDGRFIYFAAWIDQVTVPMTLHGNGRILRYDTLKTESSFSLRYVDCGHNGGLCAALPGTRFLVNTERGVLSASANRAPLPGRHHIVGIYDGTQIKLFMDGVLVDSRAGSGQIRVGGDLSVGGLQDGLAQFRGTVESVRLYDVAWSDDWVAARFASNDVE